MSIFYKKCLASPSRSLHTCMHAEWINHGELGWSSESFNSEQLQVILLMAEILYHLGCIKPRKWDKLPINWCKISAINSITKPNCKVTFDKIHQVAREYKTIHYIQVTSIVRKLHWRY